jgi:cytochrome c oxidase cbb3-type subunit 1
MWIAGIMQGLMWRSYDEMGILQYSFAETVMAMHPYYLIRALGGLLFVIGALIMVYNLVKTVKCMPDAKPSASDVPATAQAV